MFRWILALLLIGGDKMAAVANGAQSLDDVGPNATVSDDYGTAEETQHTFCKIATEELQATANATITRELRGVCTSKELKRAMGALLREIQVLKDALIIQAAVTTTNKQARRNKRKNLLDLFAISPHGNAQRESNAREDGRYSYYWTLTDVEQFLHEGASLKSPIITFQEKRYYLRLTIIHRIASVHLVSKDHQDQHGQNGGGLPVNYAVYILSASGGVRDLRLDETNAYSATLRRLRQFKRDRDTLFVKLVIE